VSRTTTKVPKPEGWKKLTAAAVPLAIVMIVILLVLPLPPVLLDVLLATNLAISILVLLTALMVRRALEFSVFPALLLVTTLTRLALNVSSTRLILLDGHAGNVIEAFGHFVVGGNLIVGLVVFLILVVIQLAVITAGAGRVSEVAARFTLDAMPGKQMAIDAELNSGAIDEKGARARRAEIAAEADFYGAMDGASKFVKGDAIASVVMVAINLIAGFAVGMLQMGMSPGEAAARFALLSVGDGLVSQIPALLISVASGILVTRVSREDPDAPGGFGPDLTGQLLGNPIALRCAAVVAMVMALLPGLPFGPFALIAVVMAVTSFRVGRPAPQPEPEPEPVVEVDETQAALNSAAMDPLRLELASDLLDLLDVDRGGNLVEKVRQLRRAIAAELGIVVPAVRTSDVDTTPAGHYAVYVRGVRVALAELPAGCSMVLTDPTLGPVPGKPTTDPVFGLPAVWVPEATARTYAAAGATVIDRTTVLVTHLSEVVKSHAAELLTRQDVKTHVETLAATAPAVAAEVDGEVISLAELHEVLRALLREGVPIRNMERIAEAVSAAARTNRTIEAMTEAARKALGPTICDKVAEAGVLRLVTFDPTLEASLVEATRVGDGGVTYLALDGPTTKALMEGMAGAVAAAENTSDGQKVALACAAKIRPAVRRMVAAGRPDLPVISYEELSSAFTYEVVGTVQLPGQEAA
jgi:flagellar biosynthesis protein FlhA